MYENALLPHYEQQRSDAARRAKKESKRSFVATPFYQQTDRAAGVACNVLF
mgnify:FL=1